MISSALLLLGSGMLAGLSNAIAGGGTFFTFPVFLAAGLPPVIANASNAVAVWPGHALAVVAYRRELSRVTTDIRGSMVVAFIGGAAGAFLLARIGNAAFSKLIPFLIAIATLLFAFGGRLSIWLTSRRPAAGLEKPGVVTRLCEFCFAVYGGFFGAGLGVMLMAGLLMLGIQDIQVNNALKNLLAAIITSVGVVVFALTGLVSWPHTLIAFVGAIVGGLLGARAARRLPAAWLRRLVIAMGVTLTFYYFRQYYGNTT